MHELFAARGYAEAEPPYAIHAWFTDASQQGLRAAGQVYLDHLLSQEQLALYRIVTRDADRFPELAKSINDEATVEFYVGYPELVDHHGKEQIGGSLGRAELLYAVEKERTRLTAVLEG